MGIHHTEVKSCTVAELPECEAKEFFTKLVRDPNVAIVHIVAKEGAIGDWAAYIGWPGLAQLKVEEQANPDYIWYCTQLHRPEDVLGAGDKLDADTARTLFPNWASMQYRP